MYPADDCPCVIISLKHLPKSSGDRGKISQLLHEISGVKSVVFAETRGGPELEVEFGHMNDVLAHDLVMEVLKQCPEAQPLLES